MRAGVRRIRMPSLHWANRIRFENGLASSSGARQNINDVLENDDH
jgi:hypothetical protein